MKKCTVAALLAVCVLASGCARSTKPLASGVTVPDWKDVPPQPGEDRWKFTEDLKSPMWTRHAWGVARPGAQDAILSGGVRLVTGFEDPKKRLDTAYEDLRQFLAAGGVRTETGEFTIETARAPELGSEAFRIEAGKTSCRISASDTEGIRRGIFYLEDEMLRRRGPFLATGSVERRPVVLRRISRCFFGPIKRPPKMRDELMDDVDYYPEQYLNRLAHEGVNGLWLTVEFRDLVSTAFTPEAGRDAEKRLAKLRRTVAACLRYGIRTYIFSIEPRAWEADSPVLKRHPELGGGKTRDGRLQYFCPLPENSRKYLYESVSTIFKSVPELGGLINISHGERATTCLSALSSVGEGRIDCPRCSRKAPWEILHASLSAMEQGMHAAAPEAELISWLYMPQARGPSREGLADWVYELPAHTPKGVILQFNFESGVKRTEFGREFVGGDYWLSTPGPSDRFERVAKVARENHTPVSAKIQTGVSHEVASVPYVPVPSLLYRKFAAMRRLGVSHTMLCWYFGNYPGLMNKAAGELSFEPFPEDEDEFLNRLASLYWGRQDAATVVKAWKDFADGYQHYPLTNLFQYYGPMHDGPVWPLLLKPADAPLTPTWLLGSTLTRKPWPPSGDRVGESFKELFTLDEIVELARRMTTAWDRGMQALGALEPRYADQPERLLDIGVARALGIQFRSGYNILRFYQLREQMVRAEGPGRLDMLRQLSGIVREELEHDKVLLALCERDSRLGFHSEAEGYKYFPEKIRWRMRQLESVLADDAPAIEKQIRANQPLFPAYTGRSPEGPVARAVPSGDTVWTSAEFAPPPGFEWQRCTQEKAGARWGASYDAGNLYVAVSGAAPISSVLLKLEPRRLWPCKQLLFVPGAEVMAERPDYVAPQTVEGRVFADSDGRNAVVRIPLERAGLDMRRPHPVRLNLRVQYKDGGRSLWLPEHPLVPRLALGADNAADLGWLLLEPRAKQ
ncbi:MAG: hypothetical protein IT165_35915 [Bryobacterales bacterium]|nr:hypothetical protein [Bryobacterales bacterium]